MNDEVESDYIEEPDEDNLFFEDESDDALTEDETGALSKKTKLPHWMIGSIIFVSLFPAILGLLRYDLGVSKIPPDQLSNLLPSASPDIKVAFKLISGALVHTILEWSAFCTAIFTAIIALLHFKIRRDIVTPIIGIALLCAGAMDAFHTLAADGLIESVADNRDLIPFTWAICRLFNAMIIISGVSIVLIFRLKKWSTSTSLVFGVSLFFGLIAYAIIHLTAISGNLPKTTFPGTSVTRPYDILPLILFLFAGFYLLPKLYRAFPSMFTHALIISMIPQVATQAHMAFGSEVLFDHHFNIGHFLKVFAYFVPFMGLCFDYMETYKKEAGILQAMDRSQKKLRGWASTIEMNNLELATEIAEKKEAEGKIQSFNQLLKTMSRVQTRYITETSLHDLFEELLEDILSLTESEYGFIGEVVYKAEGEPYLKTYAITNIAWNEETRAVYKNHAPTGLEFFNLETLFGEVIKTGEPVFSNKPSEDSRRGGLPEGHPEMNAFMGVPIFSGRRLIGMAGLANKPGGYEESVSSYLEPLLGICASIIEDFRNKEAQKRTAEALKESAAIISDFVNTAADGIITINRQGQVESFNPAAERLFGFSSEEVIGQNIKMLMPEPYKGEHDRYLSTYKKEKIPHIIGKGREVEGMRKDGSIFPLYLSISESKTNSRPLYTGIIRDITAEKKAEKELLEAKLKADQANKAKTEFLSSMSHEIRTPMNAIIGMAELLSETGLDDEQKRYVDTFRRAGDTLLTLINDILDFSKVEAGQLDLESIDFDLNDLVDETLEFMNVRTKKKGLELNAQIDPKLPIFLKGDPNRLRQIFINLIGNAIKFTEKGEILLSITLGDFGPEGKVLLHFSVSDTGIGIPEDQLEAIFEKFSQADGSTTRKYGGTGLGLAICKRIVELMQGKIWVESQVGLGSTFCFDAKFDKQLEGKIKAPEPITILKRIETLVVDDNQTNRLILSKNLEGWGARVTEAEDGQSALTLLQAEGKTPPFHLMFLDMKMPDMDGIEVMEVINKKKSLSHLNVIVMTSSYSKEEKEQFEELGVAGYFSKPIKKSLLPQMISDTLSTQISDEKRKEKISQKETTSSLAVHPMKILLVEDIADNRLLVLAYLKKTAHALDIAENGAIAVQKFKERQYDLIFMDMQMPVMDGYTATREIRAIEQEKELSLTPIIALTAYALKEETQRSLDAGCDHHLTKPIKKSVLLKVIDEYAQKIVPSSK